MRELYQRGPQNGFFLVKFWADLSFNVVDEQAAVFAVDSRLEEETKLKKVHKLFYDLFHFCRYESGENMTISVSTKVCSFGKQVVEKVEVSCVLFLNEN